MNYHDSSFDDLDNLIASIARHHAKRYGLAWPDHGIDLVQTGWVGATRASKRYQPSGYRFTTYAHWFISGDIRRACTKLAYERSRVEALDEAHDMAVNDDPDRKMMVRDLLSTPAGYELIAAELGHRDESKTGGQRRKANREQMREDYDRLRGADA